MGTTIDPTSQGKINTADSYIKKQLSSGKKIFAPVGISYIKPKDKVLLEITCICIKDLEGNNEEGVIHTEKFWITTKALWRVANWSLSMRRDTPFDVEDKSQMESIIANGVAFTANLLVGENDAGYRTAEIKSFNIPVEIMKDGNIVLDSKMQSYIVQGEEAFPKIIKKRKEYGVAFVNTSTSSDDSNVYQLNEDIPF